MAVGGAYLQLKRIRLRQRFGINAPKLARARPLFRILLVKLANSAGQATKEFRGALEGAVDEDGLQVVVARRLIHVSDSSTRGATRGRGDLTNP